MMEKILVINQVVSSITQMKVWVYHKEMLKLSEVLSISVLY